MQKIKLIAIDLDGTLLNEEKEISPYTLDVLRKAVAQGVHVAVASGRKYTDVIDYSLRIAPDQPLICSNGAMACVTNPYECVYCECMPKNVLRDIVDILEREKVYYHAYCDDGSVMESRTANPGRDRKNDCYDYAGEVLSGDEMPKYIGDGAMKLVCFSEDAQALARIRAAADALGSLEVNSSWWDNLEMLSKGVNKGAAVLALSERLDILPQEVMVFGDNENDEAMFAVAGFPVAMGNASDALKAMAKFVTKDNLNDGVGYAVAKFVLGEAI